MDLQKVKEELDNLLNSLISEAILSPEEEIAQLQQNITSLADDGVRAGGLSQEEADAVNARADELAKAGDVEGVRNVWLELTVKLPELSAVSSPSSGLEPTS